MPRPLYLLLSLLVCALFAADAAAQVTFYAISDPSLVGSAGSTTADAAATNGLIGDELGEMSVPGFNSTGSTRLTVSTGSDASKGYETGPAFLRFSGLDSVDPAADSGAHQDFTYQTLDPDVGAFTFDLDGGSFVFAGDGTFTFAFTEAACALGEGSPESCAVGLERDLVGHGYLVGPGDDPSAVPGLAADPAGDLVAYTQTLRSLVPAGSTVGILLVSMDLTAENIRGDWLILVPTLIGGTQTQAIPVFAPPPSIDSEGQVDPTVGPGDTNLRGETVWVGRSEWGRVSVLDGAHLLSEGLVVGEEAGVDAQLDVRGSGSLVEVNQLIVGLTGTGWMNITDGAVVDVDRVLDRCPVGGPCLLTNTLVSSGAGSEGYLRIAGTGSTLRAFNSATVATAFTVGFPFLGGTIGIPDGQSLAEVIIEDGGLLESQGGNIGSALGLDSVSADATLTVRGAGSKWHASADLERDGINLIGYDVYIGVGNSSGVVQILDGAEFVVGTPEGKRARVRLSGGETSTGVLRVSGEGSRMYFQGQDPRMRTNRGNSLLEVSDGGSLVSGSYFSIGYQFFGEHIALVTGENTELKVLGTCEICATGQPAVLAVGSAGDAVMEVSDGALVEVDPLIPYPGYWLGGVFVGGGRVDGPSFGGTGALRVTGATTRFRILGERMRLVIGQEGVGTVQVEDGAEITLANPDGNAAVVVSNFPGGFGTLAVLGDASLVDAGQRLQVGGAPGETTGGIAVASVDGGGTLRAVEVQVGAGGRLAGNGTLDGNVAVGLGRLEPGTSVGALHVTGDLTIASFGALALEVEGAGEDQYDTVDVDGSSTIAGAVEIDFGDFEPIPGDRFDFVRSDSEVDYASATFPVTGPSHKQLSVGPVGEGNGLRVTFVPEPGAALQAVLAIAFVSAMARHRPRIPTPTR